MTRLKVACLYRVSTKMQVEKDDIPMQRNACREFIEKQGWELVKEYSEKGVSGYKLSAEKRDVLQEIRREAEKGKFDILLVFMFDRLGRKEDETPFIVEWLHKKGIQVWSVKEGQQRFDSRVDKLLNYIRYWQSGGESEKTSIRVDEKHSQMVKEGLYRGGVAPYGYKLEKSGVVNKKGKELMKLVIDEQESKIVKLIYSLAYEKGCGGFRISKYLNEHGIPTRKGSKWGLAVTNYMLRNPIYKGYFTYGKTSYKGQNSGRQKQSSWIFSEKPVDELVIIPEEIWTKVQNIRECRTPECFREENSDHFNYPLQTKSPLLLAGFIRCGYCGSTISTAYHRSSWTKKDGVTSQTTKPVYRCTGRASGKIECQGQFTYSREKIEGVVLEEVYKYFEQLKKVNLKEKVEKIEAASITREQKELKRLKKNIVELNEELRVLNSEVPKSIMGKSRFKAELLTGLIDIKESEIKKLKESVEELEEAIKRKKAEFSDMIKLKNMVPEWRNEFEKAPMEKRKMMLAQIIDRVVVYKDKIEINLKLLINEFMGEKHI